MTATYLINRARRECHYCSGSTLSIGEMIVLDDDDFPCSCHEDGFDVYGIRFTIANPTDKRPDAHVEYVNYFWRPESYEEFENLNCDDLPWSGAFDTNLCISADTEMTIAEPLMPMIETIFEVRRHKLAGDVLYYHRLFSTFALEEKKIPERIASMCARWLAVVFTNLSDMQNTTKPNPHVQRRHRRD